ncbi:hypothetical protein QOZ80_4BG0351840 [Eleusine coracana subsp. coracana]|nr:hypothetical protein QOZ80_4BG0351840 [Eleusine coracana subsp. coracana]
MASSDGPSDHNGRRSQGPGECTDDEDGGCKRPRVADDKDDHVEDEFSLGDELAEETDQEEDDNGYGGEDYIYDDNDDDDGYVSETFEEEHDHVDERYKVLDEDDIRAQQEADVAKVVEVLSISADSAFLLLRHFKWQAGQLQDAWFSDESLRRGPEALRGLRGPPLLQAWRGYVRAALDDWPGCLGLRCPDPACSAAVVHELIADVADGADAARYALFAQLRSYVEDSGGRVKWCPGPGCARAVELLNTGGGGGGGALAADVFCECMHAFCFRCGEEAQRPVSCETVRRWQEKNASDSENANWVLAHTKHCPGCRKPIEKNQGCSHMRCRCGHSFCWLCLDPLSRHRGCSAYQSQSAAAQGQQGNHKKQLSHQNQQLSDHRRRQAKASLDRYLYHYERWASNKSSLLKVLKDMAELEKSGLQKMGAAVGRPATELAFVAATYQQIAAGRRVLRWAHAYGYYLDPARDRAKRALFEDLLDQANSCLERLHGYVELERKDMFGAKDGDAHVLMEVLKPYRERRL